MRITIGEKAPDFEVENEDGEVISLSDFHGMWVLLYFYPRDNTPGCTKEAEGFRDLYDKFTTSDVVILGVSTDGSGSHQKFKEKLNLPFTLLADEEGEVCDLYGAYDRDKKSANRKSFLIDSDGMLVKVYNHVRAEDHPQEVLNDLADLQTL